MISLQALERCLLLVSTPLRIRLTLNTVYTSLSSRAFHDFRLVSSLSVSRQTPADTGHRLSPQTPISVSQTHRTVQTPDGVGIAPPPRHNTGPGQRSDRGWDSTAFHVALVWRAGHRAFLTFAWRRRLSCITLVFGNQSTPPVSEHSRSVPSQHRGIHYSHRSKFVSSLFWNQLYRSLQK